MEKPEETEETLANTIVETLKKIQDCYFESLRDNMMGKHDTAELMLSMCINNTAELLEDIIIDRIALHIAVDNIDAAKKDTLLAARINEIAKSEAIATLQNSGILAKLLAEQKKKWN
jgi:hypothetical protein